MKLAEERKKRRFCSISKADNCMTSSSVCKSSLRQLSEYSFKLFISQRKRERENLESKVQKLSKKMKTKKMAVTGDVVRTAAIRDRLYNLVSPLIVRII